MLDSALKWTAERLGFRIRGLDPIKVVRRLFSGAPEEVVLRDVMRLSAEMEVVWRIPMSVKVV